MATQPIAPGGGDMTSLGVLANKALKDNPVHGLLFGARSDYKGMTAAMTCGEPEMARDSLKQLEAKLGELDGKITKGDKTSRKELTKLRLDTVLFKARYGRQLGLSQFSQEEKSIFLEYKQAMIHRLQKIAASLGVPPKKVVLAK